jgi:hypothetical protein
MQPNPPEGGFGGVLRIVSSNEIEIFSTSTAAHSQPSDPKGYVLISQADEPTTFAYSGNEAWFAVLKQSIWNARQFGPAMGGQQHCAARLSIVICSSHSIPVRR